MLTLGFIHPRCRAPYFADPLDVNGWSGRLPTGGGKKKKKKKSAAGFVDIYGKGVSKGQGLGRCENEAVWQLRLSQWRTRRSAGGHCLPPPLLTPHVVFWQAF